MQRSWRLFRAFMHLRERPDLKIRRPDPEALRPGAANVALENSGGSGQVRRVVRTSELLAQKARRGEWGAEIWRPGGRAGGGQSPFDTAHPISA